MIRFPRLLLLTLALGAPLFAGCSLADSDDGTEQMDAELQSQRPAILDALRVPVEKDLGQKVLFVVGTLRGKSGWVLISGRPVQANGNPIDYNTTRYREHVKEGGFDDGFLALLHKEDGAWKVLEVEVGMTDFPGEAWVAAHGAPKELLLDDTRALTPGTAERKQLLDAVRPWAATEMGEPVLFVVNHLKGASSSGWAFLVAKPVKADGSPFDHPAEGELIQALFRNPDGQGWQLVDTPVLSGFQSAFDPLVWAKKYGAPIEIFPAKSAARTCPPESC